MLAKHDREDHELVYARPRREYPPLLWQSKSWEHRLRNFPTLERAQPTDFIRCFLNGNEYPFDATLLRSAFAHRKGHEFDFWGPPHVGKSVIRGVIRGALDSLRFPYVSIGEPIFDSVRTFSRNSDETDYRILRDFALMFSNRADNERSRLIQFPKRLFLYENSVFHLYLFASTLKKLDPSNSSQPERIADTIRLWWKDMIDGGFMLHASRDVLLRRKPHVRPEFIDAYLNAMAELPDLCRYVTRGSTVPLTIFTIDASNEDPQVTADHTLRALGTWLTAVHAA